MTLPSASLPRRLLLGASLGASLGAGLARPALAQPARARTLSFVPSSNLSILDSVWSGSTVSRNHGYMVYESFYSLDAEGVPRPQMAEGHAVEDDGRRWVFRLREGLRFHDGQPVLARDCVASLQRWLARTSPGRSTAERVTAVEARDDRTVVFHLNKPFPHLLWQLARGTPFFTPERVVAAAGARPLTEIVGSGPFRFKADEYVSGSRAVYERFDAYQPRPEPPSYTAGGRRALVERVEWRIISDPGTAVSALQAGEVDWLENVQPDLTPVLQAVPQVVVDQRDPYGNCGYMLFNHLAAPTSNPAFRRAVLAAIDQAEVMRTVMGEDASQWRAPVGIYAPGTPSASEQSHELLGREGRSLDELRALVAASGYKGERVVMLHPTDQPFYGPMAEVVVASLRRVGINVDDQSMDWGTVLQRRTSKQPVDQGGWSLFCTGGPFYEVYGNPISGGILRANGPSAFWGWPDNPAAEALIAQWADAADPAEQRRIAVALQKETLEFGHFVQLGQYFLSTAWRKNLTGHLRGPVPLFWNIAKS
ncbi:ABC transporter substrate-binding protein [Roseomonas sp. 18066]|uniref:ABC transporter substrate-binding protein n=1 Tax=Roseomonas sp. 18066 TaxID=2681412 RepID=UPI001357CE07|nr:ABC transporter substrate-binding protein [Roseomonas sp. 18066]